MKTRTLLYRIPHVASIFAALIPLSLVAQTTTAPKNAYVQHNLVSDQAGTADVTDPNLVNPWGMSITATSPFWVSNHDKSNATVYNGSGTITNLVVTIPPGSTGGASTGTPTGQVPGNGTNWVLSAPNSKPASFIFATEDGTISAWNSSIAAPATAIKMVDNSAAGASYKGLAVVETGATNPTVGPGPQGPMLYAANFHAGTVDCFDGSFNPTTVSGGFKDPNLPAGYAPFNIWNLGGQLYVAYALQDANKKFNVPGAGNGVVDVFDTNGNMLQRISSGGTLNSPWGMAIAPATGEPSAALCWSEISATEKLTPSTHHRRRARHHAGYSPAIAIVNTGLWALLFGNGKERWRSQRPVHRGGNRWLRRQDPRPARLHRAARAGIDDRQLRQQRGHLHRPRRNRHHHRILRGTLAASFRSYPGHWRPGHHTDLSHRRPHQRHLQRNGRANPLRIGIGHQRHRPL